MTRIHHYPMEYFYIPNSSCYQIQVWLLTAFEPVLK